jgi:predicted flap endonuclease-1-like 5' DNA nuclease
MVAMGAFACCFWWFLLGLLLGWLLNWLLSKWTRKDDSGHSDTSGNSAGRASHASTAYSGSTPSATSHLTSGTSGVVGMASAAAVGAGAAASHLLSGSGADVALAAAAGFKIKGNNDLEIVEGIGPKIAGLFHDSGTHTFAQLAFLSLAEMHKVLENGGSRFKLANPGTWAQQARLCHENRWAELQKLQDALDGGVDNSDSHNA